MPKTYIFKTLNEVFSEIYCTICLRIVYLDIRTKTFKRKIKSDYDNTLHLNGYYF